MAFWGFYFIAKLFFYYKGVMMLNVPRNLAFGLFLMIKVPKKWTSYKILSRLIILASVIFGFLLLWHDSWFPPLLDTVAFVKQQGLPSKEYIYSFLLRYYNTQMAAGALILFILCLIADHFVKLVPVAMVVIALTIPLHAFGQSNSSEIQANYESFFDYEATRVVHMKKPQTEPVDFDLVLLHVCSLSWDDLRDLGLEQDPFFRQFQYLFSNYNSVTTYSGPAAIRLLRANCGQPKHRELYNDAPQECYLWTSLRSVGFDMHAVLNHNGVFGDFDREIKRYGHLDSPRMNLNGLPVQQYMFDNSPVYDDYATLEKWWTTRMQKADKGVVTLYYNTVSLHEGTHWATEREWWKRDRKIQYREFLTKLLSDLNRFMTLLQSSGRKVIVVFVPEHGMALRGTRIQTAGLRDIPLPQITHVPMGIKLIGPEFNGIQMKQEVITKPVSLLALSYDLSYFIQHNPFKKGAVVPRAFIDDMPSTEFESENEGMSIIREGNKYFFFGKEKKWIEIAPDQMQ